MCTVGAAVAVGAVVDDVVVEFVEDRHNNHTKFVQYL